ncbi:kinase-like domain-containing protein [Dichotomocladium elegans]|nr:kinase-like domain-containing protein [Dichotomocladium elegans]
MTDDTDSSSATVASQECSSKFWHRPSDDSGEEDNEETENQGLLFANQEEGYKGSLWQGQQHLSNASKRRQAKMLLVSLIESFCRVYGETPESNRKVFFLICQTLRSLGLIDSEFVDEMASVRSTFQAAFQRLFYTAVQTVQDEQLFHNQRRMISRTAWNTTDDGGDYFSDNVMTHRNSITNSSLPGLPPQNNRRLSTQSSSTLSSEQLLFNLSVQNSRYQNDFVEINMLGRGGFASVYRARNKLDGIDYAVKKVRLGRELDMSQENPYEKIFREIKHLARLEHQNVVRYYSSWLELASSAATPPSVEEEDEYTGEYTDDSVFRGRDPMFSDGDDDDSDKNSSSLRWAPPTSPGIDFAHDQSSSVSSLSVRDKTKSRASSQQAAAPAGGEWILYIQMQLCPATLHDYIKYRNQRCLETGKNLVDPQRNIEIFGQILEGAAYIHRQGVIHRDLKPTNIFLSMPTSGFSDHSHHHHHHHRKHNPVTFSNSNSSTSSCSSSSSSTSSSSSSGNRSSTSAITTPASHSQLHHHHSHSFSFDSVLTEDGLRECMWGEPWVPKIGDFGLAAETDADELVPSSTPGLSLLSAGESTNSNSSSDSNTAFTPDNSIGAGSFSGRVSKSILARSRPSIQRTRTGGVGTRTYASPEQLSRRPMAYDEKVDIYSLGIIFFELYRPFSTAMERAQGIEYLKQGVFPDGFVEAYPKESALILWMMDPNPAHRPTAAQLLDIELFVGESNDYYASLQSQLEAKSQALDKKTQEMAAMRAKMERIEREKQREMDAMQKRLEELQRQLEAARVCQSGTSTLALTPPTSAGSQQ